MMTEIMVNGYNGGTSFMSAFSIQKALDHFDTEQMKSGVQGCITNRVFSNISIRF